MTSRDFCYWLQGLFEVADPKVLNEQQTDLIRRHLNLVFVHEIDPSFPKEQQEEALHAAHDGLDERLEEAIEKFEGRIKDLEERPPVIVQRPSGDKLIRC